MRITKAKALLSQAGCGRTAAVAEQVGFGNNPQYFVQLFKNATGMTPRAYAKQFMNYNLSQNKIQIDSIQQRHSRKAQKP